MRIFMSRSTPARLVGARIGVFGCFATAGFVVGAWAGGLPALDERLDLGPGGLGTCLLLAAVGGLVAMTFAGTLCDRYSSRVLLMFAGPLACLALLGPGLAHSRLWLYALAGVYGLGIGVMEIAMNANSVEVETRYGRPIVSAFHGLWSAGGALGGAIMSLGLGAAIDARYLLAGTAVGTALVYGAFVYLLLPPPSRTAKDPSGQDVFDRSRRVSPVLIMVFGLVAFASFISEGAAVDWAAVHARRVLDVALAHAPIAYVVFGVAMTVIRFAGDPIRARIGPSRMLLFSGCLAAGGYGLIVGAGWYGSFVVACIGWAISGVGLATVVPVVFSTVGAAGESVGKSLSLVTAFGSTGILAGPAVVGFLAEATSLSIALLAPGLLAVLIAFVGPAAVRRLSERHDTMRVPAEVT